MLELCVILLLFLTASGLWLNLEVMVCQCCRSWLVNGRAIAKKVRNATRSSSQQIKDCGANRECPNCHFCIDNSDVSWKIFRFVHVIIEDVLTPKSLISICFFLLIRVFNHTTNFPCTGFSRMARLAGWCQVWSIWCRALRTFSCKMWCRRIKASHVYRWVYSNTWREPRNLLYPSRKSSWWESPELTFLFAFFFFFLLAIIKSKCRQWTK